MRQDITSNFLKERVRFNHFWLLLQLVLRHIIFSVRQGDDFQDCNQAELLSTFTHRQLMILIDHLFHFCTFYVMIFYLSEIHSLLCYNNRTLTIIAVKMLRIQAKLSLCHISELSLVVVSVNSRSSDSNSFNYLRKVVLQFLINQRNFSATWSRKSCVTLWYLTSLKDL